MAQQINVRLHGSEYDILQARAAGVGREPDGIRAAANVGAPLRLGDAAHGDDGRRAAGAVGQR